jgi:hypothetical protein
MPTFKGVGSGGTSPVLEPRKSLSDTAYRLTYAHHVIDNEADEVESAITEEDTGHRNIPLLAAIHQHLSSAQAHLAEAVKMLGSSLTEESER